MVRYPHSSFNTVSRSPKRERASEAPTSYTFKLVSHTVRVRLRVNTTNTRAHQLSSFWTRSSSVCPQNNSGNVWQKKKKKSKFDFVFVLYEKTVISRFGSPVPEHTYPKLLSDTSIQNKNPSFQFRKYFGELWPIILRLVKNKIDSWSPRRCVLCVVRLPSGTCGSLRSI